ncbi:MAG: beta-N-acetylhexosaminidase [Clostridia bacterium]|nr:beta-N-acetylhexosaminidase [Clostridia bacterium]
MRLPLIPLPREVVVTGPKTVLDGKSPVTVTDAPKLPEEAYELTVRNGAAVIAASSDAGVFYADQTLQQLKSVCGGRCSEMVIRDAPELPYRGFLIDSCRHFYGVEEIRRLIDAAAMFKLNRFHWHLTDDQGWRIESKRYPLLTAVGGRRSNSLFGGVNENREHTGFFTQEQIREIVAYCAARCIEVVPEIEMPGHFTAAVAAYPFLGCTGEPMEPEQKEGIFPNVLCVGNDDAVAFVRNVLDEVTELFPGMYIHIGGDEAPRTRWRHCEKCAAKMKRLGLQDFDALQGSFMKEIAAYLKTKGRTAITWNESLKGNMLSPSDAAVQRWMDRKGLCLDFAENGGRLIESDFYHYYFDYPYGMTPLKKTFAYDPFGDCADAVTGVEGALWTEFVRTFDDLCEKLFPRLLAVAERGWSGYPSRSYRDFTYAVHMLLPLLQAAGIPTLPPNRWDPDVRSRVREVPAFFKGSLTPDFLRQALGNIK